MRPRFLFPTFFALLLSVEQPSAADKHRSHSQNAPSHDGFMQGGMHHAIAKGVKLDAKFDSDAHIITLRVGPLDLPANTSHMKMPQPSDLLWAIPMSGWLLAYHPKLVDASGNPIPGVVLHHVAFWNENRSDFLCPNKDEHIFGAGGELTDWALIPGFGYRVEKGDRIRIETMIHNPTPQPYKDVFLEVAIPYLEDASPAPVKNLYPAWMDVASCGNSSYDLPPGASTKTGNVPIRFSGILLGVGGHMHDYGQRLTLEASGVAKSQAKIPQSEASRTEFGFTKSPIAVLPAETDAQGHLLGIPVITFFETGGYALSAGQKLRITAAYNNSTGKALPGGAMGIVVGYFVPHDPRALSPFRHPARRPPSHHDMSNMAHDR
jgi:hypothetical protein